MAEGEQLGFLSPGEKPAGEKAAWAAAPALAALDEAGVQQALDEGLASFPDLELELRVLLWWRGNDAYRCAGAPVGHSTSTAALS